MAKSTNDKISAARFLEKTQSQEFNELKDCGGRIAANEDEIEKIRNHILEKYDGMEVIHNFIDEFGQAWDCVPFEQQPSVRRSSEKHSRKRDTHFPGLEDDPGKGEKLAKEQKNADVDQFGNLMECPSEAIPIRRVTLENMARFPTLDSFFQKAPRGGGHTRSTSAMHRYAHASQEHDNVGGYSNINVWKPKVDRQKGEVFSLSQQWFAAGKGGKKQTVECGWQVYPDLYVDNQPNLFIGYTPDGYNTFCYNLDCSAFVQTSSRVLLGGAFGQISDPGGEQIEHTFAFFLDDGDWWFSFDQVDVGYYPKSVFKNGDLPNGATSIDFGGETAADGDSAPPMGSGKFANSDPGENVNEVAYQRLIGYYTAGGPAGGRPADLILDQPTPTLYKARVFFQSNWQEYMYFGGPGESSAITDEES